ncbi:hypothetical protein [Alphaproteobacteria bacterium endosymbiont of Tiliacea citrago]|uniref:hypothetical protein n=1 Tax=Alphaproteobacteria bacterium endosymbiont of Tiliacea citrago TaxID=3077944 RepID=UPI00313DFF52
MLFKKIITIILGILLIGCEKKGTMKGRKEIILIPKNNINQRLSLKIYIVQIFSEEALNEMSGMEADQFFEKSQTITLQFPNEIKVWEYDLVENTRPICFVLPSKKKYWGVFVFFKFIENVEKKFMYPEDLKSVEITLEDSKFEITNINRKFKYTKEKIKTPFCEYLDPDQAISNLPKKKTNKKRFS